MKFGILLASMESMTLAQAATQWIQNNPDQIFNLHRTGQTFVAIEPELGVIRLAASSESAFQAELNELIPSYRQKLFLTNTALFVVGVK